jgi:hypothetical protein
MKRIIIQISMKNKEKEDKNNWQPLRELALNTPYTMGYLSLMARRKQLKVKKIGRVWHSTMENIKDFEEQMKERKEQRKRQLQDNYREKVKREVLKEIEDETSNEVMGNEAMTSPNPLLAKEGAAREGLKITVSSQDTIFDEVQKELEDVLQEIRDREKKLRQDYLAYRGIHGDDGVEVYGNAALAREKQETEELSEKLIMDLGRLLNTANRIHEEEESAESSEPIDEDIGIAIPVKNKNAPHGNIRTMGMDFKRADNHLVNVTDPAARSAGAGARQAGRAGKTAKHKHKDNFLSVPYSTFPFEHHRREEVKSVSAQNKLLLFISGLLVFIAAILIVLVIFG